MERMLAAVEAALQGRSVLVLLSGGRDSTCLLDLAVRAGGAVTALHVNYRLRPEADAEEEHCQRLAARLQVPIAVEHPKRPGEAGNLQAWARDARYAAAARRAAATGGLVAAGHTATDQVETILYRLASSPGRRALLGMRPRDGLLVRPLLGFTREDTAAYCAERGLEYVDDPSNASDEFARARLRRGLVPALRAIHPAAEANILRTVDILRDEAAVLDELVTALLRPDGRSAELALLRAASPALARLAVQRLADDAAGRPAAGIARRAVDILALDPDGPSALDVGAGLRAQVRDGVLRFGATPPLPAAPPSRMTHPPSRSASPDGEGRSG